ncbi:MAG: hypothetical protein U5O39_17290 [Gammaproteobacteria bacterium]|nr:hypothetical protein [Gammaproteobacteria bacterium]
MADIGVLELVRRVGDEIAANLFKAKHFGEVLQDDDGTGSRRPVTIA